MDIVYESGTAVEFNWGPTTVMSGVVDRHRNGWLFIRPEGAEGPLGIVAVRETQVWLPGEDAKEPDKVVELSSTVPGGGLSEEATAS